jgi:phosphatidylserine/phosphatidylglycerophosphate/cardiolipin synthase-like enzyme
MEPLQPKPLKDPKLKAFWERQIRYISMWAFIAIASVLVWLFSQPDKVYSVTESVPIIIASNQTDDNLQKTVKEAIKGAKESVTVMIYSLIDPQIIDALRQKAESGVPVTIIVDAVASQDVAFRLGPKVRVVPRRAKGLMHIKIVVTDHTDVWFGSVNFTPESFFLHANLLIGIRSRELAREVEEKVTTCIEKTKFSNLPIIIKSKDEVVEFCFLPDCKSAIEKLLDSIETAQKSIRVAMYTFTNPRLADALIAAHNRGVAVDVVMDFDSAKETSHKIFVRLKREGVPTSVSNRNGLLHHKLAIIDSSLLATGSANWTRAAFASNDDVIAFIYPLTESQEKKMDEVWQRIKEESKPSLTSSKRE